MYRNLEAEITRKQMKKQELAKRLDLAMSTLSQKLSGKSQISLHLARKIKLVLGVDIPIEVLFEESSEKLSVKLNDGRW